MIHGHRTRARATAPRSRLPLVAAAAFGLALPAAAQQADPGLVTTPSPHAVRATLDRFAAAVKESGWVVFTEIDHAQAARDAGLTLRARTVIVFGNPRAGTGAMQAKPTLAIDLPMRALVWEDEGGRVFITRSSGEDTAERVFARHGIVQPAGQRAAAEAFLAGLVQQATR